QVGPLLEALHQQRQQLVRRGFLHEADEGFELAEGQLLRLLVGTDSAEAEVGTERRADGGGKHPAADVRQEFTTIRGHGPTPGRGTGKRVRRGYSQIILPGQQLQAFATRLAATRVFERSAWGSHALRSKTRVAANRVRCGTSLPSSH